MRDNEELMGMIRQYLKQKAARSFSGKYDIEVVKKEIKDEVTHILYDQTRRTPIVIPVVNEVGGAAKAHGRAPQAKSASQPLMPQPSGKRFPRKQTPDTETVVPRDHSDSRSY